MQRIFIRVTLLIFMTFVGRTASGNDGYQQTYFTHVDNRHGLSENNVKSITQDPWGFIWFGTKNGLNRYDGRSIKQYDVDDYVSGRGNHNVSALFCDKDSMLWVGTDKGVFCFNPLTETFRSFDVETSDGVGIGNWISQITADQEGRIWIVSPEEGVFAFNKKDETLRFYSPRQKTDDNSYYPQCLVIRPDGQIWIGTSGQGIFLLDRESGNLRQMVSSNQDYTLLGNDIYTMTNYGEWILIAEHEGRVMKYRPKDNQLQPLEANGVHYKLIRAFDVYKGIIYVGTHDGLYMIDERNHTEGHISHNRLISNGLSDNMIYSLFRDCQGGLWIGTMKSGADYMPGKGFHFFSYMPNGMQNSLSSNHVREMQKASDNKIWISTEEGNICIFDPQTQLFESLNLPLYKGGSNRLALMAEEERMWSGLFKNGLDIITTDSKQVTHYSPEQLGLSAEGSVYALCKSKDGKIWLGTGKGVYVKQEGMRFSHVDAMPDVFVQDIAEDHNGTLWISTIGSGLYRFDPRAQKTTHFLHDAKDMNSVSSNDISSITIDRNGDLWLATDRGGLCMYDMKNSQFRTFGKEDGLLDDVTYKVLEDSKWRLWFGTNHGLVCFDRKESRFRVYHNDQHLPGNQFNYKSAIESDEGYFYFGGSMGLIGFNPNLAVSKAQNHVYLTQVKVNREEVHPSDGMLQTNIIEAEKIVLPYDFSSLSFNVSSLDYSGTETDSYEYMLSGVDEDWIFSSNGKDINYSRLQPGEYIFRVKQSGTEQEETQLKVIVKHPWWSSLWMKIIYALMMMALAYMIYRIIRDRQLEALKTREDRFKEEQDKELLRSKINFFTDITHEIRTPLTLINGSVENIREENVGNAIVDKNIKAIDKNTRRLLNLTNQLLDFRKVDSNMVTLAFTNVQFSSLLTSIISRFEPTINHLNKTISLDMANEDIEVQGDNEAITKILSNLLNNALKYSESFIDVKVTETNDEIMVSVENDGAKIPKEKAEDIFQPFTQLDNSHRQPGSGLGLPMARSLAELHKGSLRLNTASEYNNFILTLPKRQEHVIDIEGSVNSDEMINTIDVITDGYLDDTFATDKDKKHTILVVEDNPEVLQMICNGLQKHYNVEIATDGMLGLKKTQEHHIDLVITDVMMPVMDGNEMTKQLKEDVETSHIPIIMLTAKHTLDNRIEGLKAGADAYIEKPFSFSHLHTQVETLLTNRKRERESFVKRPYLSVENTGVNKVEEKFISKITELITQNIRQPEFNVEQLASEMCMSRSSLNRKIKEVSDMTPIDFIRLIRLKKAAELIREHGYNTSEVCEMVGISSPSYFIKLFQRQFGMTPKEFAQQKK